MPIRLTKGQKTVLKSVGAYPFILWAGSIRAGKTFGSSLALLKHADTFYPNGGANYIVAGKTQAVIQKNVIPYLNRFGQALGRNVKHIRGVNARVEISTTRGKVNTFYYTGGGRVDDQDSIQGMTAAGVLIDELSLIHKAFYYQAIARCSEPNATMIMTMNKTSPRHWTKLEVYDRFLAGEMPGVVIESRQEENFALSRKRVEIYNQSFSGFYKSRLIDNEWAMAEGLVYPNFESAVRPAEDYPYRPELPCWLGADYAVTGMVAVVCMQEYGGRWIVVDEYRWHGATQGLRRDDDHIEAIRAKWPGEIKGAVVDRAAPSFRAAFHGFGITAVGSQPAVVAGQIALNSVINGGIVIVSDKCEELRSEAATHQFKDDNDSQDSVIKANDHGLDALRYLNYELRLAESGSVTRIL